MLATGFDPFGIGDLARSFGKSFLSRRAAIASWVDLYGRVSGGLKSEVDVRLNFGQPIHFCGCDEQPRPGRRVTAGDMSHAEYLKTV